MVEVGGSALIVAEDRFRITEASRRSSARAANVVRGLLLVLGTQRHAAFAQDPDGGGIVEIHVGGDGVHIIRPEDVGHHGPHGRRASRAVMISLIESRPSSGG
jgi:hypothetical protein